MHILIIETGVAPSPLDDVFGRYPAMFETLLACKGLTFSTCALSDGAPLPPLSTAEGVLITGSPAGVYEPYSWITPLEEYIREAMQKSIPTIGICFGHQIMAQALGGRVEKSDKGWGVGIHEYAVQTTKPLVPLDGVSNFTCAVSHQDQVVELPVGARCLAGSSFCPNGMIAYEDGPGLSMQMHPEFSNDFGRALLSARLDRIPQEVAQLGLSSYDGPSHRHQLLQLMSTFWRDSRV